MTFSWAFTFVVLLLAVGLCGTALLAQRADDRRRLARRLQRRRGGVADHRCEHCIPRSRAQPAFLRVRLSEDLVVELCLPCWFRLAFAGIER